MSSDCKQWLTQAHQRHRPGSFVRGLVVDHLPTGVELKLRSGFLCRVAYKRLSWVDERPDPQRVLPVGSRPVVRILPGGYRYPTCALRASYRVMLPNPYHGFLSRFPIGTAVEARIESLTGRQGIGVRLSDGCKGVVTWSHAAIMPPLEEGQTCKVRVVSAKGTTLSFALVDDVRSSASDASKPHEQLGLFSRPPASSVLTTGHGEDEPGDAEDGEEGRVRFRLHRYKERRPRLVRRKKQMVRAASGRLACEVCDFDFAIAYGPLGDGFAECHHRTPLADLSGVTRTRMADLAIVCANCHRMLHRRPYLRVEQLREVVQGRRVTRTDAEPGAAPPPPPQ